MDLNLYDWVVLTNNKKAVVSRSDKHFDRTVITMVNDPRKKFIYHDGKLYDAYDTCMPFTIERKI